jgi:drug/metabolite transporter (DMT)-like permease
MPIFNVVLAAVFLGEKVRTWRWGAVIVGLIGVLVMLWPHLGQGPADDTAMAGALFALIAAFLFSIAMTQVRHLSATETTAALVFFYSLIAALISLVTLFWGWVIPSPGDFAMLFAVGVVGGLAQILMTESLRHAEAGVIAPFAYVSMIWATAIGWVWFGELPGTEVVLGALIVIGAGLLVIWRETKRRKKRAKNIVPPNIPAPPST